MPDGWLYYKGIITTIRLQINVLVTTVSKKCLIKPYLIGYNTARCIIKPAQCNRLVIVKVVLLYTKQVALDVSVLPRTHRFKASALSVFDRR